MPGGSQDDAGSPTPWNSTGNSRRSIAIANARRTRTSSNGGSAVLNEDQPTTLGIRFARVDPTAKARMLRVLNDLKRGPARMPSAAASQREPSRWVERVPRGIYETHVPILGLGNFHLDGRDLSPRGVRVTTHPALALGANLRLSFACTDGRAPVVVDAEVARSDGPRGTVLCFDWLDDSARGRLIHLVESLPPVGCPQACEETDTTLRTLVAAVLRR